MMVVFEGGLKLEIFFTFMSMCVQLQFCISFVIYFLWLLYTFTIKILIKVLHQGWQSKSTVAGVRRTSKTRPTRSGGKFLQINFRSCMPRN